MASRSLGTLTIDMVLKTFGLKQGMDKAEREMDAHAKKMEARAYAIGRGIGTGIKVGIGAAVAAGGFFAAITKQAIDFADQMRDMSIRTGLSTERLSEFAYAARSTGTDIDTLATGLRKLAKVATEGLNDKSQAHRIFEALGITKDDLRDFDALIPKLAERFKQLPDGVQKTALAMQLFGKSGDQLIEFLSQGEDGLAAFAQRASELGIVIDTETASKADQFKDTLDELKLAVTGVGIKIASDALPKLIVFADWFVAAAVNSGRLETALNSIGGVIAWVGEKMGVVARMARQFGVEVGTAIEIAQGMSQINADFATLGIAGNGRAGWRQIANALSARKATLAGFARDDEMIRLQAELRQLERDSSWVSGTTGNGERPINAALIAALSGKTPTAGRAGKSAMSEADREAKRLLETFNRLAESQKEQIALFGKTDEVSRMLYRTQQGDLSGLSEMQKEQLLAGARRLDQMREEARLMEESTRRDEEHARALRDVLEAIEDERATLGMSSDERERYNNLKRLSADASDEERAAVERSTTAMQQQRREMNDSIALKDEWRNGMVDAITDVVTGAKSLKDAFTDFFDSLAAMITEMIAKRWVEQLFGQTGSNQSGNAGGFLNSLFGALFGGGRASGGAVSSGRVYEVGEGNRPELFMSGGREYMIPGNNGRVVPMSGGGRSMTVNQVINVPRSTEYRSAQQVGQAALVSAQRALMRNA